MWQPYQLPAMADKLKAKGLEIDAKSISKLTEFPMNAVISLGGCTASFVSPKGLVVTNHHCAYGSIQYNSTPEKNLLRDGFLAKNFAEELPATPGSRVYVTEEVTNVTDKVKQGLDNKQGDAFYKASRRPRSHWWPSVKKKMAIAVRFTASTVVSSTIW